VQYSKGNVLDVWRVVMTALEKTRLVTIAWNRAGVFASIVRERVKGESWGRPDAKPLATSNAVLTLKLKASI
jgi:hypothetical protein